MGNMGWGVWDGEYGIGTCVTCVTCMMCMTCWTWDSWNRWSAWSRWSRWSAWNRWNRCEIGGQRIQRVARIVVRGEQGGGVEKVMAKYGGRWRSQISEAAKL